MFPTCTFGRNFVVFEIDAEVVERIENLATSHGTTSLNTLTFAEIGTTNKQVVLNYNFKLYKAAINTTKSTKNETSKE